MPWRCDAASAFNQLLQHAIGGVNWLAVVLIGKTNVLSVSFFQDDLTTSRLFHAQEVEGIGLRGN